MRSVTRPRPPARESQMTVAPWDGHSPFTSLTFAKPSTNVCQRDRSSHRSSARSGGRAQTALSRATPKSASVDLADDLVDGARDRIQERPHVAFEALVLGPPLVGDRV